MITMKVRGLDGFRTEITVAQERLVNGIPELAAELADDTAKGARGRARSGKRSGDSMNSIRAHGPKVTAGNQVPWYGFADFGGKVGAGRRISRPYIKGGRWLFPAVKAIGVINRSDAFMDDATEGLR